MKTYSRLILAERRLSKAAVQCLDVEAGDFDKPKPRSWSPTTQALGSVFENDVDPVVADRAADRMRNRCGLAHAVEPSGGPVVERERVPGEPAVRPEGCS